MSAGTVAGKPRPRARPRPGTAARGIRPGTAARLGAVVGAVAVASLALDRIFAGHLLAVLMTGAAAAAAAVSAALARARGTWAAPLSVLALAGYGTAAAAWTAHRADVPGPLPEVLAGAAAHALPRLLGAMLPVEPQPDTVLAPVAAAWLAALLGAEVLLRSGRVLLALAPAAALFAGGLYLVGPNAAPAWWHAAAFAALTAAALARRRWPVAAAAGLAAGALAAGALAPVLTARPADPRAHLDPPVVDSLDENPLARLSGWAMRPRQELFTVALSRPAGARMRLAVLVDYDGVGWRVDGRYRHAGRTLPLPTGSGGTPPVRQEVTVTGLAGRLLPALARPHHVTGARVAFDADSGTLLGAPLRPGARYAVTSVPPPPPGDALADAEAPHGPAVRRLLELGADPPPALAALAERLGGEAVGAYARAAAVEEYLRTHYRLVADAPSGHAYPNLEFFLFGPAHAGGQRGTSEQFAAAYAVLARLLGLPARVVVGFRLPAAGGPVRAGDAVAWPEVLFEGHGWVPFDPLPAPRQKAVAVPERARARPEATPPVREEEPPPEPPAPPPPPPGVPAPPAARGADLPSAVAVLLLGAAAPAAAVRLARHRLTRRRLCAADPAARVRGAWWEVRDAHRLAGLAAPGYATAGAVAAAARARGAPPLEVLAEAVNAATFSPHPPSSAQAEAAVAAAVAHAAHVRGRSRRRVRAWWRWHPGPLWWAWRQRRATGRPSRPAWGRLAENVRRP